MTTRLSSIACLLGIFLSTFCFSTETTTPVNSKPKNIIPLLRGYDGSCVQAMKVETKLYKGASARVSHYADAKVVTIFNDPSGKLKENTQFIFTRNDHPLSASLSRKWDDDADMEIFTHEKVCIFYHCIGPVCTETVCPRKEDEECSFGEGIWDEWFDEDEIN